MVRTIGIPSTLTCVKSRLISLWYAAGAEKQRKIGRNLAAGIDSEIQLVSPGVVINIL
jgi:hypothetical protein